MSDKAMQCPFFYRLLTHLQNTSTWNLMKGIEKVWNEIGLEDDEREEREKECVNSLAESMVTILSKVQEDELECSTELTHQLRENKLERNKLQLMLDEKQTQPPKNLKLLQEAEWVSNDLKRLHALKMDKMKSYLELIARKEELEFLLGREENIYDKNSVPSLETVVKLMDFVGELSSEKEHREHEMFVMTERITDLINILGYGDLSTTTVANFINYDGASVTVKDFKEIQNKLEELENVYEVKIAEVNKMIENIINIYHELDIPDIQQHNLVLGSVCSMDLLLSGSNYIEIKQENNKMNELKKKNLGFLLNKSKNYLEKLQEYSLINPEEIERFDLLESLSQADQLYAVNCEVKKLKEYISDNEELLMWIWEIKNLGKKSKELKKRMNNPERLFKARGNQMVQEEKDRKQVNTLPKKCKRILECDHSILVYGIPLHQYIQDILDEFLDAKEPKNVKAQSKHAKLSKSAHSSYQGGTLPGKNSSQSTSKTATKLERITRSTGLKRQNTMPIQVRVTRPSPDARTRDLLYHPSCNSTEIGHSTRNIENIELDDHSTLIGGNFPFKEGYQTRELRRQNSILGKGRNEKRNALRRSRSYSDLQLTNLNLRSKIPEVCTLPEETFRSIPQRRDTTRSHKSRRRSRSLGQRSMEATASYRTSPAANKLHTTRNTKRILR